MPRHKKKMSQENRDVWKDEYRQLSNEIHGLIRDDKAVPEEKSSRLRILGRFLRSQSGD